MTTRATDPMETTAPHGGRVDSKATSQQNELDWQQHLTADEIELAATFLQFLHQCEERFSKERG
jgi:hypothetical protein